MNAEVISTVCAAPMTEMIPITKRLSGTASDRCFSHTSGKEMPCLHYLDAVS